MVRLTWWTLGSGLAIFVEPFYDVVYTLAVRVQSAIAAADSVRIRYRGLILMATMQKVSGDITNHNPVQMLVTRTLQRSCGLPLTILVGY